ncbi:MAG: HAD-IIB family hydrolase, partial [Methylophaga sp.]
ADQVDAADHVAIMDAPELFRFIQFYQRLTEHCLQTLPSQMDTVLELNSHRQIIALHRPNQPKTQVASDLLIFTDLDGSLLDHHHYRHDEADELLSQLAENAIPVIPASSKTHSEIERLRHSLNNTEPFICENGAAICIPVGYFADQPAETVVEQQYWLKTFVKPRQHWLDIISTLKPQFGIDFTGFADAGIDGIIDMTGLDVHAAARAAHREYGEAIAWHGSPARQKLFIEALQKAGAQVLQGGRFLHVSGACDKGQALNWLLQQYQHFYPQKNWQTLAIGDSDNDIAMLQQADLALLIPSPVHGLPPLKQRPGIYIAPHTGPRGWAAGVQEIIEQQFGTLQPQEHAHG